jgi:hypothetical protein
VGGPDSTGNIYLRRPSASSCLGALLSTENTHHGKSVSSASSVSLRVFQIVSFIARRIRVDDHAFGRDEHDLRPACRAEEREERTCVQDLFEIAQVERDAGQLSRESGRERPLSGPRGGKLEEIPDPMLRSVEPVSAEIQMKRMKTRELRLRQQPEENDDQCMLRMIREEIQGE